MQSAVKRNVQSTVHPNCENWRFNSNFIATGVGDLELGMRVQGRNQRINTVEG